MQIARLLSSVQIMMLREAAEVKPLDAKNKAIDEVIEKIKKQNPEKFFHYTKDKPDPAMRHRKFHDEPRTLPIDQYAGYSSPYPGNKQHEVFAARRKA